MNRPHPLSKLRKIKMNSTETKSSRSSRFQPLTPHILLKLSYDVISLFQASDSEGRRERKRHAPQFPSVLFSCLRFLNSANPTISEPGIGYDTA